MKLFLIGLLGWILPQVLISQPAGGELTVDNKFTLKLPFVGFEGNPGKYQNVIFRSEDAGSSWTLLSVDEGLIINTISAVDMVKTSEHPMQVFLRISGVNGSCAEVGDYAISKRDNFFDIFLYYDLDSSLPTVDCTATVTKFSRTIPLPVYGLAAGEYEFSVNSKVAGSFVLTTDNLLR